MANVRNRLKLDFIEKDGNKKKLQSNLTSNGIYKSYENCDSYTFKQNEVFMDKLLFLGFSVLELSKLHINETFYDELEKYFGQEKIQ